MKRLISILLSVLRVFAVIPTVSAATTTNAELSVKPMSTLEELSAKFPEAGLDKIVYTRSSTGLSDAMSKDSIPVAVYEKEDTDGEYVLEVFADGSVRSYGTVNTGTVSSRSDGYTYYNDRTAYCKFYDDYSYYMSFYYSYKVNDSAGTTLITDARSKDSQGGIIGLFVIIPGWTDVISSTHACREAVCRLSSTSEIDHYIYLRAKVIGKWGDISVYKD